MSNPPITFLQDRAQLDDWMARNRTVPLDASRITLESPNLAGLDLAGANFTRSTLNQPDFRGAAIRGANFENAILRGGHWDDTSLQEVGFAGSTLEGVVLDTIKEIHLTRFDTTQLRKCSLKSVNLQGLSFASAKISDTNLRGADLRKAVLTGVALTNCDLRGAQLTGAELTNTTWYGCKVDSSTVLRGTIWRPQHDSANDGVDDLALPGYRRLVNWEVIRILGRVPLFSGAYVLLTAALFVGTGIALFNEWFAASGILGEGAALIPFPDRLTTLLLGSAALAVGATVFEFACPTRVKEFSRTRWVEELRRPGLIYVVELLQRPMWNVIALSFTLVGAGLLGWLFIERLVAVLEVIRAAT